jgi:2-hydroxychromene-2-carboxylate isomerase
MRSVTFYLDLVSPYTWLALVEVEAFAERHGVVWDLQPVVYGALLTAHGLVGPVETPAKRRYTMLDVARCAAQQGRRLVGPPQHPFRSLEALRILTLFRDDARVLALAVRLSEYCWGAGRSLTDPAVLEQAVTASGLDPGDLASRIACPEVKDALRDSTGRALARGVFGVPTFSFREELFWGYDRLDALSSRLGGAAAPSADLVARLIARPAGASRIPGPSPPGKGGG